MVRPSRWDLAASSIRIWLRIVFIGASSAS
jgi:hypothetical protein